MAEFNFCEEHNKYSLDTQLILKISGRTPNDVIRELRRVIRECDNPDIGKPLQGIGISFSYVREVITPVWNGIEY